MSAADSGNGAIIFDLDGVVYRGSRGIDGAGEALSLLGELGWVLLFATNNASKDAQSVQAKIADLTGYQAALEAVVTCGMSAASYVKPRAERVHVLGEPALKRTLQDAGLEVVAGREGPDAVVVGINFSVTYQHLDEASRAIRDGAEFIATNTDAAFPTADGLAPGAGAIVAAIATASGVDPVVTGKPEQPMIDLLVGRLDTLASDTARPDTVWVVGDRPETDILMGHRAGWRTVLPLSGVIGNASELEGRPQPDHVVDSIADLPHILGAIV